MAVKPLRYALIEDEPPARAALKTLMEDIAPGSCCVAEAEDGLSGLELMRNLHADLLFLDIEFPPDGAFGMLKAARAAGIALPPIAFVTAYDRFAVEAFRWAACDYLLKPVEPEQLRQTLERVKPIPDMERLMEALDRRAPTLPERFTVNVKGRLRILHWRDVSHLVTENRLVFACTDQGRFIVDRSLDELEGLLAAGFLRIHRSALVNLAFVKELQPDPGHTSRLLLLNGEPLSVSRDRLAEVRRALG